MKSNALQIAIGAALIGAGAAAVQVSGAIWSNLDYIAEVAGAFGLICGLASAGLNRLSK
jgi:hypothetical protein